MYLLMQLQMVEDEGRPACWSTIVAMDKFVGRWQDELSQVQQFGLAIH